MLIMVSLSKIAHNLETTFIPKRNQAVLNIRQPETPKIYSVHT